MNVVIIDGHPEARQKRAHRLAKQMKRLVLSIELT